jgi:hypothetical protein
LCFETIVWVLTVVFKYQSSTILPSLNH